MALYTPPSRPRTPPSSSAYSLTRPPMSLAPVPSSSSFAPIQSRHHLHHSHSHHTPSELLAAWPTAASSFASSSSSTTSALQTPSTVAPTATSSAASSSYIACDNSLYPNKHSAPPTPPMTSTFETRRTRSQTQTVLPPITHLDRHHIHPIHHIHPLTPPEEAMPSPPPLEQPVDRFAAVSEQFFHHGKPTLPSDAPQLVDWLDFTQNRPTHSLAEKTCEMICYLWFSTQNPYPSPESSPPFMQTNPTTSHLQFIASPPFVQFMQKLLETTQVSQSVIVLSLHYIHRLKERNRFSTAQSGSEFRIAVAALMMANKFLDDNTYTNKTWSEVSGIGLSEINRMEREFLMGVNHQLYVDKPTYESWLSLLKGLVYAKDRDTRRWRSRGNARAGRHPSSTAARSRQPSATRVHRARSTSPSRPSRNLVAQPNVQPSHPPSLSFARSHVMSPMPHPGHKRTADTAFSPRSQPHVSIPAKRPQMPISLRIPDTLPSSGPSSASHSPVDGLRGFSGMTLDGSPNRLTPTSAEATWHTRSSPRTLASAYRLEDSSRFKRPENLYFYALSCSPIDNDKESKWRKSRLRYQQPLPPLNLVAHNPPSRLIPMNIQSASASPHDVHMRLAPPLPSLPHFSELAWTKSSPSTPRYQQYLHTPNDSPPELSAYTLHQPQQGVQGQRSIAYEQQQPEPQDDHSPIRLARFANAGPPGYQFYHTSSQGTPITPLYAPRPQQYWSHHPSS